MREKAHLADLLVDTKDGDWGLSSIDDEHSPHYVIRGADFPSVRLGDIASVPLRYLPDRSVWRRTLKPNDVLLETAGGSKGRPTGRTVLVSKDLLERFDAPVIGASFTRFLRPDPEKVDPRFLFWYLQYLYVRGDMDEYQVQHTGVARFQYTLFSTWKDFYLPGGEVQRGVAAVLGALDDKSAANARLIDLGTQWMRARWQQITMSSSITVQWSEVVDTNPPTPTRRGVNVSYLDMKNLPQQGLLVERWESREPRGGARFVNGDTLLARITPCFENGKLGLVDFLDDGDIAYGSTEFIVYRPRQSVPAAVAYCVVADESFREEAARSMTGTSGRQRVQASALTDYGLKWPSDSELADFGVETDTLLQRMGAARDENQVLSRTRDELLPLLMNGKITVKQAEAKAEEVL